MFNDTLTPEGEDNEIPASLPDADAAALGNESLEDSFKKDEKPYSRAEARIKQLNQQKKEAVAKAAEESARRSALEQKLSSLESKLESMAAKSEAPIGAFDKLSNEDLIAFKAKYMDHNNQEYSPAMVAKIDEEYVNRKINETTKNLRSQWEGEQRSRAENARVFNETVAELGEAGRDLANPNSPLTRLANQKYDELIRELGKETVERTAKFQKLAIKEAWHELRAAEEAAPNKFSNPNRGRLQARDQLAAQSEAAVTDANEIDSLLKKRDVKGALAKTSSLRFAAAELEAMRRRPKR